MADFHAAALIGVIALVTAILRFLPFVLFRGRQTPAFITYLGQVLPVIPSRSQAVIFTFRT